jgi:hypothetical protein
LSGSIIGGEAEVTTGPRQSDPLSLTPAAYLTSGHLGKDAGPRLSPKVTRPATVTLSPILLLNSSLAFPYYIVPHCSVEFAPSPVSSYLYSYLTVDPIGIKYFFVSGFRLTRPVISRTQLTFDSMYVLLYFSGLV